MMKSSCLDLLPLGRPRETLTLLNPENLAICLFSFYMLSSVSSIMLLYTPKDFFFTVSLLKEAIMIIK